MSGRVVVPVAPILTLAILTLSAAMTVLGTAFADPAVSPQSAWKLATPKPDGSLTDPLVKRGKDVFDARCRTCHGAYAKTQGPNSLVTQVPGTYALELRYKGKLPAMLEERTDLTPQAVATFVRRGGGGIMPPFRPTEVSDEDLKALGAYIARKR